jgi:cation diffusion facilitator CzcD-associated flavoprotein CzcO
MANGLDVAVIGAGLGGLCAGIKLKEAGFNDLVILEKGDRVGGTWRDNSYPGCCCDVPVSVYQYSFAPSLNWSHIFPRHDEIQKYTEDLADNFGLRPHLQMNDETRTAVWDESRSSWKITTASGKTYESRAVVAALGQLNRPKLPDIEGRDTFKGASFHSARWDHGVSLKGKRVAIIGSAASAVQIIPEVAKEAAQLTVFQRTPNWVIPRLDRPITDEEKALMMTAPQLAAMGRDLAFLNADTFLWQAFSWTKEGRDAYTRIALNHLAEQVPDAAMRQKLTPDYPIGCKRVLIADDFYPALMRPNVTLVTEGISRITPAGVDTRDGQSLAFDVIVYATGFETTGWQWSLDVIGRGGRHLRDEWASTPQAYKGLNVSHFPNMFILYGPNTNLGHNSITSMLEHQVGYTVKALSGLRDQQRTSMDITAAAQEGFNRDLQEALAKTTWADPRCHSWYKNDSGHITQNWSSNVRDFGKLTESVAWQDYDVK